MMPASSTASFATLSACRRAWRRTERPYSGIAAPGTRKPTRRPACGSALSEPQTNGLNPMPSARTCSAPLAPRRPNRDPAVPETRAD